MYVVLIPILSPPQNTPKGLTQSPGVNAFAYMLLARMIYFFLPRHMVYSIPASVLAIIFVSLDFVSFVIQLTGGSYAGPTAPVAMQMKGVHIYMGGIGLQQFFILIFLGLAVKFHLEMSRLERQNMAKPGWQRLLFTIYGSLVFITVGFHLEFEQCRMKINLQIDPYLLPPHRVLGR